MKQKQAVLKPHLHEHVKDPATVLATGIWLRRVQNVVGRNAEMSDSLGSTEKPYHYIRHAVLGLEKEKLW